MTHAILTFVYPVAPHDAAALRALLATIGADPGDNAILPLRRLACLHFSSMVLHDDPVRGTRLIFEANVDGSLDAFLTALLTALPQGMHAIHRHCTGYRITDARDFAATTHFMRNRAVVTSAGFVGNVGRSVQQIVAEAGLRARIEAAADTVAVAGASAAHIDRQLRTVLGLSDGTHWATDGESAARRFGTWIAGVVPKLQLGLALIGGVLGAPLIAGGIVLLRIAEARDRSAPMPPQMEHVADLLAREDPAPQCVMNHLANVSPVKPGALRLVTLRAVLGAVNLLARAVYTKGQLGGIPSIHFAHWSLIDDGTNLLFMSNYDGSWESYLGDFIDQASSGLTAIWSNTVDFPPTRFLINGGARYEKPFKAIARARQVPTLVWYRAYDGHSVRTIDDNSAIRRSLLRRDDSSYLARL